MIFLYHGPTRTGKEFIMYEEMKKNCGSPYGMEATKLMIDTDAMWLHGIPTDIDRLREHLKRLGFEGGKHLTGASIMSPSEYPTHFYKN